MDIRLKRAYDKPARSDGFRVLVDRMWPRGVSKDEAKIDEWMKKIAPSTELRKRFHHDPDRWEEFKKQYFAELEKHVDQVDSLRQRAEEGTVTLIYAAKDRKHNNALALKEYLSR